MSLVNRTNFLELLFPAGQLEALGNKWEEEPSSKRRKLELPVRRHTIEPKDHRDYEAFHQRKHRASASAAVRHVGSVVQPILAVEKTAMAHTIPQPTPSSSSTRPSPSCLPSFIEPSIMHNFLQHMHPKDRSRYYSAAGKLQPRQQQQQPEPAASQSDTSASSPASLVTDSTRDSPAPLTPPEPGIYESLHIGPYAHLLDGMRITLHERSMVEDLLAPEPEQVQEAVIPKATEPAEYPGPDYSHLDDGLLATVFPLPDHSSPYKGYAIRSGYIFGGGSDDEEDDEDEDGAQERYQEQWNGSVDDFFDLDKASEGEKA